MTVEGYTANGLLVLAITVNCLSVYLQKRENIYEKFGDKAHKVHSAVIFVFWLLFIASYVLLETQTDTTLTYENVIVGYLLKALAVSMFVLSISQIGLGALSNKDLFTKERRLLKGIYNYVSEPIYVSYTLFIFGSALVTGIEAFYYMSLISLIGLQIVEAKVEALE